MCLSMILSTALLLFHTFAVATAFSNYGSEFYLGLLKNYKDGTSKVWLEVTTRSTDSVQFTVQYAHTTISAAATFEMPIEIPLPIKSVISSFQTTGYSQSVHIATQNDTQQISVTAYNWASGSVGEYLALPCHHYLFPLEIYEYFLVSTESVRQSPPLWSQGLLVGCQDGTIVNLTPSVTLLLPLQLGSPILVTIPAGETHQLVLNAGQTLYIGKPDSDLTGTRIVASKPLTVISGHECSNVPLHIQWCEHLTQQIPPTVTWGKKFLLAPLFGKKSGQYYKVVTSQDSTIVNQTCNGISTEYLSYKGSSLSIFGNWTTFCYISANKPILVAQLGTGSSLDSTGDPIMIIVQPMEQYSQEAHFNVQPEDRFGNSYISVISTDPSSVLYDKAPINSTEWTAIYDATGSTIVGYGCHFPVSNGTHSVKYFSGAGSVMVYGFHCHPERGYGFPASIQVKPINEDSLVTFEQSEYSVKENDSVVLIATVRRLHSMKRLSVAVKAVSITADEGIDYKIIDKFLNFDVGETAKQMKVAIINDEWVERREHFNIKLLTGQDRLLAIAKVIIYDDDSASVRFLGNPVQSTKNDNLYLLTVATSDYKQLQTEIHFTLNVTVHQNRSGLPYFHTLSLYLDKNSTKTQTLVNVSSIVHDLIEEEDCLMVATLSTANDDVNVIIEQPSLTFNLKTQQPSSSQFFLQPTSSRLPSPISPTLTPISQVSPPPSPIPKVSLPPSPIPKVSPTLSPISQVSPTLSPISQVSPPPSPIPKVLPPPSPIPKVSPPPPPIPKVSPSLSPISQISPTLSQISQVSPTNTVISNFPLPESAQQNVSSASLSLLLLIVTASIIAFTITAVLISCTTLIIIMLRRRNSASRKTVISATNKCMI